MSYKEAKNFLLERLSRALVAHEEGRYDEVGADFDAFESMLPCGVSIEPEYLKLFLALEVWAGWVDACNHTWEHHEPLTETDWPIIARHIIDRVSNDLEIDHSLILKHFEPHLPAFPGNTGFNIFTGAAGTTDNGRQRNAEVFYLIFLFMVISIVGFLL